jgi:hypothetical protein
MRLRAFAPALLSAALYMLPSSAHAATPVRAESVVSALAASRAGHYRLTLTGGAGEQLVDLAIVQEKDGFTALLLTPAHESWMSNVKFDGRTLTATVLTSMGPGTLVLAMSDTGARGTLRLGGRTIAVSGTRDR